MNFHYLKNRDGAILLTTILILIFLSVLGLGLMTYLMSRQAKSNLELERLKALYLAEAAIARSIHELRIDNDEDNNGLGNIIATSLGGGSFRANHNFQASTITGIGEYQGVKRTIQIKYSAL